MSSDASTITPVLETDAGDVTAATIKPVVDDSQAPTIKPVTTDSEEPKIKPVLSDEDPTHAVLRSAPSQDDPINPMGTGYRAVRKFLSPILGKTEEQQHEADFSKEGLQKNFPTIARQAEETSSDVEKKGLAPAAFSMKAPWSLPTNDEPVREQSNPLMEVLLSHKEKSDPTSLKVAKALYTPIANTINALTSPIGLGTAAISAGAEAVSGAKSGLQAVAKEFMGPTKLGSESAPLLDAVHKGVAAVFASDMGRGIIENAPKTIEKFGSGDTQETLQAGVELLINASMMGLAGHGAFSDVKPADLAGKSPTEQAKTLSEASGKSIEDVAAEAHNNFEDLVKIKPTETDNVGGKPLAPANFMYRDELPPNAPKEITGESFKLNEPIEGHPAGSNVSRTTLEKLGYHVPETPDTEPGVVSNIPLKELDTRDAEGSREMMQPNGSDFQYTVFDHDMKDAKGNRVVQVDDIRGGGDGRESGSLDSFRGKGVDLPDIPNGIPPGRYTLQQIRDMAEPTKVPTETEIPSGNPPEPREVDLAAAPGSMSSEPPSRSRALGIVPPGTVELTNAIRKGGQFVGKLWNDVRSLPEFGKFRQILNKFNGESQIKDMELATELKKVMKAVPDELTQKAMYALREAGGSDATLQQWASAEKKLSSKRIYEAALKLTPEQRGYAAKIGQWFDNKFQEGVKEGVLGKDDYREKFMPHDVEQGFVGDGPSGGSGGGKFNKNFGHAKERTYDSTFDLEAAGFKNKTKDIVSAMATYASEMNKAILTRKFLKELVAKDAKTDNGEPLAQPVRGVASESNEGDATYLSNPSSVEKEGVNYKTLDHPSFKKWYWSGKDTAGNPIFQKGEIGLHPDIYGHVENLLGRSLIKQWYDREGGALKNLAAGAVKAFEESQKFVKQNMLGSLSSFHAVHEAKRAAGNLVAPWDLKRVTPDDPDVRLSTRLGLQLGGDMDAMKLVQEGVGSGDYNLINKLPVIGRISKVITDMTFHDLIPAYKLATWKRLYGKNLELFADDIRSGKATKEQVGYLTSNQVNARFGHQNYADIGRDPTFHHILSMATLAPDFWISNIKNYGQVLQGMAGAKVGRQPLQAFVVTAGTIWLASRILNKALDDKYHFDEPFSVVVGNRKYTMRNEAQDLAHLYQNWQGYVMGRLGPVASSVFEALAKRNWRGELVDTMDVLKEAAVKAIPISLKWVPGASQIEEAMTGRKRTVSRAEEFMSSQGIQVSRHTPLSAAYNLASDWMKKQEGYKEDRGTYPTSKYQQLRYALEDNDLTRAREELKKLTAESKGKNQSLVNEGFFKSVHGTFTHSKSSEDAFEASLNREDLAKVREAKAYQARIWDRYNRIK